MSARSDAELAASARGGDRGALDELLSRHVDRVHQLCRRILRDPHDALDATQNALIAVALRIDRFDGRAAFSTWLYRVTTNAALDEARRRARRPVPVGSWPERPAGDDLSSEVADRVDIERALDSIPVEFRAAVALRDLADLSYEEIGDVLDVPPGTVRSRIARGRTALAAVLRSDAGAGSREPAGTSGSSDREEP